METQTRIPTYRLNRPRGPDMYAHYFSYATLVSLIPLLGEKLFELRWIDIFGGFMEENGDVWIETKKNVKFIKKLSLHRN